MAKRKAGLHKRVSSIFDGAPVPAKEEAEDTAPPQAPAGPLPPPPTPQIKPTKPPATQPTPAVKEKLKPEIKVKPPRKRERERAVYKPDVKQSRQRTIAILLCVLAVVLAASLFQRFYSSRPAEQTEEPSEQQFSDQIVGLSDFIRSKFVIDDLKINWKVPEPYPTDLRDPMYVPEKGVVSTGQATEAEPGRGILRATIIKDSIIIKSILYSEEDSTAVIGDEIVREGQTVLGAKVIKINPHSIEFEVDGERFSKPLQD
jgi:hypothetical protein